MSYATALLPALLPKADTSEEREIALRLGKEVSTRKDCRAGSAMEMRSWAGARSAAVSVIHIAALRCRLLRHIQEVDAGEGHSMSKQTGWASSDLSRAYGKVR